MKIIIKGALGGIVGYLITLLISRLIVVPISPFNKGVIAAFCETTGVILLFGYGGLIGGSVEAFVRKKAKFIYGIIGFAITVGIFYTMAMLMNEGIAMMVYLGIIGAFVGHISRVSEKLKFFLMFTLPSFSRIPRYKWGDYPEKDAEGAQKMAELPLVALTAGLIIGVFSGIETSFKESIIGAITGSFLGLIFGLIYLMIIGTIIRKFIGLGSR